MTDESHILDQNSLMTMGNVSVQLKLEKIHQRFRVLVGRIRRLVSKGLYFACLHQSVECFVSR